MIFSMASACMKHSIGIGLYNFLYFCHGIPVTFPQKNFNIGKSKKDRLIILAFSWCNFNMEIL